MQFTLTTTSTKTGKVLTSILLNLQFFIDSANQANAENDFLDLPCLGLKFEIYLRSFASISVKTYNTKIEILVCEKRVAIITGEKMIKYLAVVKDSRGANLDGFVTTHKDSTRAIRTYLERNLKAECKAGLKVLFT